MFGVVGIVPRYCDGYSRYSSAGMALRDNIVDVNCFSVRGAGGSVSYRVKVD